MSKELCVTSDFMDDLRKAGRHFTEGDLDEMMKYLASLGATRCEWILDTIWTLYDQDSPVGFDLLAVACDTAHRHGLRFDVVFKPYEGALSGGIALLPDTLPCSDKSSVLRNPTGLVHIIRPFVAEHPEMCLARRAEDGFDPGGSVSAIRLIKNDDQQAPFGLDQLSIWTSSRNGGYTKYDGPIKLQETVDWRPVFPDSDQPCRILTLEGLELPKDARFFLVRCQGGKGMGHFTNSIGKLVELVNKDNQVIASTPSCNRINSEEVFISLQIIDKLQASRYMRSQELGEQLFDRERLLKEYEGMFHFQTQNTNVALEQVGEIAVMRGKLPFINGVLHPIYPEVRQHWLDHIQFCIDRGVDGVNIRVSNHNHMGSYEQERYGFNMPIVNNITHPENTADISRANGEAHTQFLREAQSLLHTHGKELGVHVNALMLRHDDRNPESKRHPSNFDWQWEVWLKELADYVEFRGAFMLRPENTRQVIDRIGMVAREAGIPLIFQSNRGPGPMHFDGPHPTLAAEMDWVRNHPDVAAYNLYETAHFSRINSEQQFEGSPDIADLVRARWWQK